MSGQRPFRETTVSFACLKLLRAFINFPYCLTLVSNISVPKKAKLLKKKSYFRLIFFVYGENDFIEDWISL